MEGTARELLNTFPARTWIALRAAGRAEALAIEREASNDVTTKRVCALQHAGHTRHGSLEGKEKEAERGVKGMDRISCDSAGSQRDCKLDFLIFSVPVGTTSEMCIKVFQDDLGVVLKHLLSCFTPGVLSTWG